MFWNRVEPATSSTIAESPGAAADEFFTPGRFALLLGTLLCVTYPEVIIGKGTFFHRDFAVFGYPLAFYHRESFWRGEVPLWNPLNHCGLPFLAQWNTMTLYPLSLFYLLFPLAWSLGVFCLGHLFLGGMGLYFLSYRWTSNRFASAMAGVAYSFSALMLHSLMWPNNISAMAWLPWIVLAIERACLHGGRWLLFAVFTGTFQMLSGAPEIILLTWLLVTVLLLGNILTVKGERWRMLIRFVGIVLWVATLASVQLLPFLDLLAHSQRDKSFADSVWSMPVWGWTNLFFPLYRMLPTALGIYAQPDQFWIPSYYIGIGVTVLALLALIQMRQQRRVLLIAAITIFCLLLALGKNGLVYSLIKQIVPGLGFIRYPIKFVILPVVLLPLLASVALAHLLSVSSTDWPQQQRRIGIVAFVLLLIIAGLIGAAFLFPLPGTSAAVAASSGITRAIFLILTVVGFIFLRQIKTFPAQTLARVALLFCFWLDAITAGARPNPTTPLWVYAPNLARKELHLNPEPEVGSSRVMLNAVAEDNIVHAELSNAVDQVVYNRLAFYANINLLDDVPKVVGMYSIFFRELGDVFVRLYGGSDPPKGLADFLAISHINQPGKATHWDVRPTYMTWVSGGQRPQFAGPVETVLGLGQSDFDPRKTVFLPLEARSTVNVSNVSAVKVSTRRFSAHRVELDVESTQPALVVISQSFDHNWRAYEGNKRVPLLRANHAFQALVVPTGRTQVRLAYRDQMFYCGAVVSFFAALAWVAAWIRLRKRLLQN
jgi:hypothetical protein